MLVVTAVAVVVGVRAGLPAGLLPTGPAPSDTAEPNATDEPAATPADAATQDTLLLVRAPGDGGPANGVTLLAAGPGEDATVVFLPVGTLVDVPGFGLERLGLAYRYDGAALVQASVENALGVQVDHVASVTDADLAALLEHTGGLRIDVAKALVRRDDDGAARVRFEPGSHVLDGSRLAEYWAFRSRGEEELASLPRQQQVLDGLLAEAEADPDLLDRLFDDDTPLESSADADWLHELFATLAEAREHDRLTFTLLPVEPFGRHGEDSATYRLSDEAVAELVADQLAASTPAATSDEVIRLQVLNGVGEPGIGQAVDRRLDGSAFRLVRTDNAANFDYDETHILVYDESSASLAAARRVQRRLGVGTIRVSRQSQSIIDLTIVVGADFLDQEQ